MKLKTLKDIQIIGPDGVEDSEYVKRLLKAEAIKWIKRIDKDRKGELKAIRNELCITREWIKRFFNLTEKDLEAQSK